MDAASERFAPDVRADWVLSTLRSAETLEPLDEVTSIIKPDGDARFVRTMARPHRRNDGTVVWDGVALDVTDFEETRRALEQAKHEAEVANAAKSEFLAEAQARADKLAIYEAVPIGIVLFDRDFRFLRVNDRLAAINGRTVSEHVGQVIEDVLLADVAAALRAIQPRLLAGEDVEEYEMRGIDPRTGAAGAWLVSYRPLFDGRRRVQGFLGIVFDVTARPEGRGEAEGARSAAVALHRGGAGRHRDVRPGDAVPGRVAPLRRGLRAARGCPAARPVSLRGVPRGPAALA